MCDDLSLVSTWYCPLWPKSIDFKTWHVGLKARPHIYAEGRELDVSDVGLNVVQRTLGDK